MFLVPPTCASCSGKKLKTYPVSGVVKFEDGTAVKFGRIEFYQPDQDVTAYGSIGEDGTFVIGTETEDDGAVAGSHQVVIMQMVMSAESGIRPPEGSESIDHGTHIDPAYSRFDTSGLDFTVEPKGRNTAEFVVRKNNDP